MASEAEDQIVNALNSFLPANLYALDFTAEHYKKLLDILNISDDEKIFEVKRGTLAEGLVEYFKLSHQNISVKLSLQNCLMTKYFLDDSGSVEFDRLLYHNSKLLMTVAHEKNNFYVLPFLLLIPAEIKDTLFKLYLDKQMPIDKARHLTRQQVQPIFNLSERDIVFFLRGRMWIRYFTPPKNVPDGKDKRFAGESAEQLDAMYKRYFPKGMWKDIESILGEVLEEKLNFSIIDNATFSKTFIPVFRGMIEILLIDVMSPKDCDKIEGLTGYILRIHFDKILLYTAKNLLLFVENRDKNAEIFIKEFSDDTLIDSSGKKTKKYAIVDEKQQTWNYVTILSILLQYKQAKLRIISQNKILADIKEQLKQYDENLTSEKNNQVLQEKKVESIVKKIADNELKNFKNKEEGDLSQIKIHKDLLSAKRVEENELYLIKNRIANTTIELTRQQKKLKHESEAKTILNDQIEPLIETYNRIANALALVLTKR